MVAREEIQYQFEDSIDNAEKVLTSCIRNQFIGAQTFLEDLDKKHMYHAMAEAYLTYLQAQCTFEKHLIDNAHKAVKNSKQICDKFRRKYTLGVIRTNDLSEIELHAELCFAECLLANALLSFLQYKYLAGLTEGALNIRQSYSIYKSCMRAIENKTPHLVNSTKKADFESGVYLGLGVLNVLLSSLSPRVTRILKLTGLSGNKKIGLNLLDKGRLANGLRSPFCTLFLLNSYADVQPSIDEPDIDVDHANDILQIELQRFPDSSLYFYFSGWLKQSQRKIEEAISEYKKALSLHSDWQQLHHICYWGMMRCYSVLGKWELAAHYSETLSTESKWSKYLYLYMHAAFLIMHRTDLLHWRNENMEAADKVTEIINNLLEEVKENKKKRASKPNRLDKFAVARVKTYQSNGKLLLPGLRYWILFNFDRSSSYTILKTPEML